MIKITDKQNCCACSACASICPKQCISMVADSEGFLYPEVNEEDCIDCGLCEKVCNELHPFPEREPLQVLAAINNDEEIRQNSSSGGMFFLLAEKVIKDGGVVFGARFDEHWQVLIDYSETMDEVKAFMGSKYVQARIANAYKDVKRFLADGRKVLFSGTPCQVAGLHQFLRKKYGNLITIDFICHGTPSPKVWELYLKEVIKVGRNLNSVEFRNKSNGWKNFGFKLEYNKEDSSVSMLMPFHENPYMKAFLRDIILRPSCYDCKAKSCRSQSDITIADFWGISSVYPEMDDDKGTSLVFLNSEKASSLIDFSRVKSAFTTYETIKPLNPACYRSPIVHPKRQEFFDKLDNQNLFKLIEDCTKPTMKQRFYNLIIICKSLLNSTLRTFMCMWGGQYVITNVSNGDYMLTYNLSKVISINFRNKKMGWKGYHLEIRMK